MIHKADLVFGVLGLLYTLDLLTSLNLLLKIKCNVQFNFRCSSVSTVWGPQNPKRCCASTVA